MELEKLPWVLTLSAAGSLLGAWIVSVLGGHAFDASVVVMISVVLAAAAMARERRARL